MPIYTRHARNQMRDRRITEEEVEFCLASPEMSWTDVKGNPIYIAYPKGRRIKVVLAKSTNPPKIITVAD